LEALKTREEEMRSLATFNSDKAHATVLSEGITNYHSLVVPALSEFNCSTPESKLYQENLGKHLLTGNLPEGRRMK